MSELTVSKWKSDLLTINIVVLNWYNFGCFALDVVYYLIFVKFWQLLVHTLSLVYAGVGDTCVVSVFKTQLSSPVRDP